MPISALDLEQKVLLFPKPSTTNPGDVLLCHTLQAGTHNEKNARARALEKYLLQEIPNMGTQPKPLQKHIRAHFAGALNLVMLDLRFCAENKEEVDDLMLASMLKYRSYKADGMLKTTAAEKRMTTLTSMTAILEPYRALFTPFAFTAIQDGIMASFNDIKLDCPSACVG